MKLEEFVIHKTRWLNGFNKHMKLGDIDFKTYKLMNGVSSEEFDVLNKQSERKDV